MNGQRDVFEIIERMGKRIEEQEAEARSPPPPPAPELQLQPVELGETFSCSSCGRFAFQTPTTCYWCRT